MAFPKLCRNVSTQCRHADEMNNSQTHAADYCSALVRRLDPDRWFAAQYGDAKTTRRLIALYAFYIELQQIPGAVSEPPLGEIRLQWRRDALRDIRSGAGAGARAQPVMEEMASTGFAAPAIADQLEGIIDAAARPLYGGVFSDIDDLGAWLGDAHGAVDQLAVTALGGDSNLAAAAKQAGIAFALARFGPALAPRLEYDINMRATKLRLTTRKALRAAPPAIAPAIAHLGLTRAYLRRRGKPFPLMRHLHLLSAVALGRY